MEKYKLSKYNFFIENAGNGAIYNAISNEIFSIEASLFKYLKEGDKIIDCNIFDGDLISYLHSNGIIVKESENELESLHYDYHKDKYDDSFLSMIIYPTLKCNFCCHYCYESLKNTSLSEDNQKKLTDFLVSESKKRKFIATRWSGGEPLLVWNKIYEISKSVIKACQESKCDYISSIVCNGYLLTKQIVEEMLAVNITSIQITLDGPPKFHNKIRHLSNGGETFDKILSSIELASKYMKVIVRLNLDKENVNYIDELFSILGKSNINKSNVRIFCKPIICTLARTPDNPTFTHSEFYSIEKRMLQEAIKNSLTYAFHWGTKSRNTRCVYHTITGFLVDPDLNLYRCPMYVGGDGSHRIGNITSQGLQITNKAEYFHSLSYSPFENKECMDCKVLPICNGKCPVLWELSGRKNDEGCIPDKHSLDMKLQYALKSENQLKALNESTIN